MSKGQYERDSMVVMMTELGIFEPGWTLPDRPPEPLKSREKKRIKNRKAKRSKKSRWRGTTESGLKRCSAKPSGKGRRLSHRSSDGH